ncbi:alpha/beta fold hydrolase [Bifidobacterium tissieri]|uniref:Alpha/beta fold hydrolase n=1 Tax=Bifidobacterium tissieri TaxID=1630162 RepID=A0A5N0A191_9BIFI|nr:alpha/beta fold hydrolase [Bifidobacterium tissieri]KAA8831072.1 alpha/beta fold hydrolase [Bifidobacterium tissieri]KAA8833273.1 alpha/beta fold hydrolase [Bifidobacterium tissieri]
MTDSAGYFVPGFWVRDHTIEVPLDWNDESKGTITLFYREITAPDKRDEDLPLLLHLQGGPGGKGQRPMPGDAWLGEAVRRYRVIMPDQRGTGKSTPVDGHMVEALGSAEAGAEYLSHFLADSIVRDFEYLRTYRFGSRRWTTIGQSYGGFLTLTYLSLYPQALGACMTMGGIPGVPPDADDVYRHTYPRAALKSRLYYERYPQDERIVADVADYLDSHDVRLPNGDPFSVRRLQSVGSVFGMGTGFDRIHWLFDEAFTPDGRLADTFLYQVLNSTSNAGSPLYWTLQEFIYGNAHSGPMDWAAERELPNHPEFDTDARPLVFFGEMTFRWMFREISCLKPFLPAVELLMQRDEWPVIYRPDVLAANEVPLQSLVYFDDLYVDSGIQLRTLSHIGNAKAWVTNEYQHDGITHAGVFTHLDDLIMERGGAIGREANHD